LQFVIADLALRGAAYRARPALAIGAVGSAAAWGLVVTYRGRRPVRVAASAAAAAIIAVDAWVYRYYGVPIDRQVVLSAMHNWADVRPIVHHLVPWVSLAAVAVGAVEYAWLGQGSAVWEPRARAPLALLAVLGVLAAPPETGTPDLRAFSTALLLTRSHEASASKTTRLPALPSAKDDPPSVLFILTESVRASSYCSERRQGCPYTPELDLALPDRTPLRQMRAVASYTAVSAAAIVTGRTQEGPRAKLASAPTLFDYAGAVRAAGRRLTVAYWSAQSAGVLERDVRGAVDSFVSLETLLGHGVEDEDDVVPLGVDRLLAERVLRDLPRLPRPFVLVLHLAGTHAPYFVDEARAPFRPINHVASFGALAGLENAYEDAIIEQDHTVAACVRAFLASQGSAPWLILLTSDHGEAFGEHGAIHHGQNLYDEQIHVPAWIAWGGGALDDDQRRSLLSHEDAFVTHLDLLPTMLDALGVWRGLALVGERAALPGQSLLEPTSWPAPIPITNCTGLFPCPLNTWGVLDGDHALSAQPWDGDWNCVDLARGEEHASGPACQALRQASRLAFPLMPSGAKNGT
jgi:Sulfatase